MDIDKLIIVSIGPLIGLLGVAYSLIRNYNYAEKIRKNELGEEIVALAAGLQAELKTAQTECLGKLLALEMKKEKYERLANDLETRTQVAQTTLKQYIPKIDRVIYESNASKIGRFGAEISFSVVSAYSQLNLAEGLLQHRKIETNQDMGDSVNYVFNILNVSVTSIKKALEKLELIVTIDQEK